MLAHAMYLPACFGEQPQQHQYNMKDLCGERGQGQCGHDGKREMSFMQLLISNQPPAKGKFEII